VYLGAKKARLYKYSSFPFLSPREGGAKYCDQLVCMSVCPLAYLNKSSAVAEISDHSATIDMGRKAGAAVSLSVGELGPHLTQYCLGRGLHPYHMAS